PTFAQPSLRIVDFDQDGMPPRLEETGWIDYCRGDASVRQILVRKGHRLVVAESLLVTFSHNAPLVVIVERTSNRSLTIRDGLDSLALAFVREALHDAEV